ncbi:hypothetical protein ACJ73_09902 [Blastomyces percursus]|uniref:Uncharacterized protein n=1 Tax=Blastomyces percursus TaxID=1658174 RepID=A0A1J9Q4V4_9EURO|nr:hypothetical protein ACJ73_09902 [Blastomyces percursus]
MPAGRPRIHSSVKEGNRHRQQRYREKLRRARDEQPQPDLLAAASTQDGRDVFADLHAALDAIPVDRAQVDGDGTVEQSQQSGLNLESEDRGEGLLPIGDDDEDIDQADLQPVPDIISTQSGPSEGLSVEHDPADPALVESVDATIHPTNEGEGSRSVELLAEQLVEQLEHHHGCSEAHHSTDPSVPHTVSLSEMADWRCPDILAQTDICRYPTAWETILPPDQRRQLYSGIPSITRHPSNPEASPAAVTVDLEHDAVPVPRSLRVQFDIDSAGGLASSLAVAREGLEWRAGRPPVSSPQSSLHLDPLPVYWYDPQSQRGSRRSHRPMHQIPHLPGENTANSSRSANQRALSVIT